VAIVIALVAAFMLGTGVALQHQQAATMSDDESVRPGLLIALIQRPLWLLGLACDVVGFGLQAVALERGSLVVVEPVVATSLVFSLLVLGAMTHVRFSARELGSAVVVIGGLTIFLWSASPTSSSHAEASMRSWITCGIVVWGAVAIIAAWATSKQARVRGGALAVCAGLAAGFLAVSSKAFGDRLGDGVVSSLGSWQPYVLIASGIVTTLMLQSAYQANAPTLTFPLIEITGPLTAATIGIVLFDESISLNGWRAIVVVLALALMIGGIVNLGRDSLITAGPSYENQSE
jgi:drug/metabolite transporter (DMT)-like permease